jgi:hypothetical protein
MDSGFRRNDGNISLESLNLGVGLGSTHPGGALLSNCFEKSPPRSTFEKGGTLSLASQRPFFTISFTLNLIISGYPRSHTHRGNERPTQIRLKQFGLIKPSMAYP